jgi:hypothetical protein
MLGEISYKVYWQKRLCFSVHTTDQQDREGDRMRGEDRQMRFASEIWESIVTTGQPVHKTHPYFEKSCRLISIVTLVSQILRAKSTNWERDSTWCALGEPGFVRLCVCEYIIRLNKCMYACISVSRAFGCTHVCVHAHTCACNVSTCKKHAQHTQYAQQTDTRARARAHTHTHTHTRSSRPQIRGTLGLVAVGYLVVSVAASKNKVK